MRDVTKPQLFLDDTWIEDQSRITRLWHKPEILPEPIFRPEMPWEGTEVIMYGTVFWLGDRLRMYYSTLNRPFPGKRYLCVAESINGLQWNRLNVGSVEFEGSKHNNIVLEPTNSPSIMYEPDDRESPFKLIYHGTAPNGVGGMVGAVSQDGLRWDLLREPLLTPVGDHKYLMFTKVGGKYVAFVRKAGMTDEFGARVIFKSESNDFSTFTPPELVLKPDLLDAPDVEFYCMAAFPYGDMFLGLIERYNGVPDFIDMTLAWSDDLKTWKRPSHREAFIGPEYPWNRGWNTNNSAGPVIVGNQLYFYFGARSGAHSHQKNGPPEYGAIGLATLTVDRFASITAGFKEGILVTRPITWPGGDLLLNASTTRHLNSHPLDGGGVMTIEVLDETGDPVVGYSGVDRAIFNGNIPSRAITDPALISWPGGRSLNDLAGRRTKLLFRMRDAHLYSFRSG